MRTSLNTLVTDSLVFGNAVPAFTCYDFTTARAVVAEAGSAGHGVILLVAPKTAASVQGLRLITALRSLADAASVPVSIQLDHASDIPAILAGLDAGADAVLADGSSLDLEANIALVRAVRDAIADPSIVIEAELGGLAGDEDRAFAAVATGLTDAGKVASFVRDSGRSCLPWRWEMSTANTPGNPNSVGSCCARLPLLPESLRSSTVRPEFRPVTWPKHPALGLARSTSTRSCEPVCCACSQTKPQPTVPMAKTSWGSSTGGRRQPATSPPIHCGP